MWPSIVVHGAYVCNLFMTKFSNVYLKKKKKKTVSKKQILKTDFLLQTLCIFYTRNIIYM